MKKQIFHFTMIAAILLLIGCSNAELLNEANPQTPVKISLTATMPGGEPSTRVMLDQQEDNTIRLTWEADDQIELVFVQGEIKKKSISKVISISNNGKKAQFDIVLPIEIQNETFDLYGVYGGGGLSDTEPTHVKLPENPSNAASLEDAQQRKDVMLYFASKNVETTNPKSSVIFTHLGSLFSINVKNTGATSLENLSEARLVGPEGSSWAFNSGDGGGSYDLLSGEFLNTESAGSYISFNAINSSLPSGNSITFWGWYPPLPDRNWPELKLQLRDANNTVLTTSIDSKLARTTPTEAGKSHYFFAVWDGSQLKFIPPLGPNEYFVATMGTLGAMLNQTQKDTITTMIVKGEINKADFEVMKKQMPKLRYLDLEDVICEGGAVPYEALGGYNNSNKNITTIILPQSIKTIEGWAFSECTGLTGSLNLPKGLTMIGNNAFSNCSGLSGSLTLPVGLTTIEYHSFLGCTGLKGSLTLPDGLTTIDIAAFAFCGFTGSLSLPAGLESIRERAFNSCSGFTDTLTFPDGLSTIGKSAFNGCTGLSGLEFGNSLVSIGPAAFFSCSNISGKVIFPISLRVIVMEAFTGCDKIDAFRFPVSALFSSDYPAFPIGATVEVPLSEIAAYKAIIAWESYNIVGYYSLDGNLPDLEI